MCENHLQCAEGGSFQSELVQSPSLSQWDFCEHSGPSSATGIWGLPGVLVGAGADWRMWMDVIQCKILANRCEPEFLHGLGWLGLEQGQTEVGG